MEVGWLGDLEGLRGQYEGGCSKWGGGGVGGGTVYGTGHLLVRHNTDSP